MRDAYIYDALRSPRGKGRSDGSLHEDLFTGQPIADKKIVASVDTIIKKAGAALSVAELAQVQAAVEAATAAQDAYESAEEWRQWQKVLDLTQSPHWAKQASAAQKDALSILQDDFDATVTDSAGWFGATAQAWNTPGSAMKRCAPISASSSS